MRNTLEGGRTDMIRQVGPEHCFLSEFWTKNGPPKNMRERPASARSRQR
jgi:hypothetical protein